MTENTLWIVFGAVFVVAVFLDLFFFSGKAHIIPLKQALLLSAFWIGLGFAFNGVVYFALGTQKGLEFLTGFLIEKSLSVDNLFVFLAIFTYFAVPREAQRTVLLWGILGALVFRGIFIFAGIALIQQFHFLLYVLGAVLIYTGIKLAMQKGEEVHPEKNPLVRFARRLIRVYPHYQSNKFFTRVDGALYATPLIIALVAIETMDIMFAIDSVPAVFAITLDPFIVYSSNVFAILGLRALFFVLSGLFYLFRYLAYGLCGVLVFVGVKMLVIDVFEIPVGISLSVVGTLIFGSILVSILLPPKGK